MGPQLGETPEPELRPSSNDLGLQRIFVGARFKHGLRNEHVAKDC